MNYTIREMIMDDWIEIRRIYQEGMDTNLATFEKDCPEYEDWDKAKLKVGRWVILIGSQIAGFTTLTAISSRKVFSGVAEVSIYIDRNYEGKGLGTILLNHLVLTSEEQGFWTLQSGIMTDNLSSIALHKKCGFKIVGHREKLAKDQYGNWRDIVLMERRSTHS